MAAGRDHRLAERAARKHRQGGGRDRRRGGGRGRARAGSRGGRRRRTPGPPLRGGGRDERARRDRRRWRRHRRGGGDRRGGNSSGRGRRCRVVGRHGRRPGLLAPRCGPLAGLRALFARGRARPGLAGAAARLDGASRGRRAPRPGGGGLGPGARRGGVTARASRGTVAPARRAILVVAGTVPGDALRPQAAAPVRRSLCRRGALGEEEQGGPNHQGAGQAGQPTPLSRHTRHRCSYRHAGATT